MARVIEWNPTSTRSFTVHYAPAKGSLFDVALHGNSKNKIVKVDLPYIRQMIGNDADFWPKPSFSVAHIMKDNEIKDWFAIKSVSFTFGVDLDIFELSCLPLKTQLNPLKLEFRCGSDTRFRCSNNEADPDAAFTSIDDILAKNWTYTPQVSSTSECKDRWCINCTEPYDQLTCPDLEQYLDCSVQPAKRECSGLGCKTIPALMSPDCITQGCVGHNWKTTIIQLYSPESKEKCNMADVNIDIVMKLVEQAENPDHTVTVAFRGEGDEDVFSLEIEFSDCVVSNDDPTKNGCTVEV